MPRKNHLIVDSGCTQDNERWSLSACGLNEDSEVAWDGTHQREFVSCKRCLAKMAKPRPAPEPFHKERPILFNGAMVRAILSGQKTVTRRPIKGNQIPSRSKSDSPEHQWIAVVQDHPRWGFAAFGATEEECAAELAMYGGCPYGRQGDRLWVRETWYCDHSEVMCGPYLKPDDLNVSEARDDGTLVYAADGLTPYEADQPVWKPSIHMPRWACRILLEITDVRVERLQDITYEQAVAEGVHRGPLREWCASDEGGACHKYPIPAFRDLWQSTGGDWDANPWVWVVEFKRVQP
ncbi:hypothetical protein [Pseudomonas jessenii]|uniref:Morphogenetic protein n=1 Tax=Pseudomonas jessenii TaxID=77298 RepID=A0A370S1D1_PSEJE|nr:hypothetical protein [Pseudomonas jessenii]RDL13471.1 hypothetical protein DEU51_12568 [Pseudomonas jessenii]